MGDEAKTPIPDRRLTRGEWEREQWERYTQELQEEQRGAVPPWGLDLASQVTRVAELVRATNAAVGALTQSVDRLQIDMRALSEAVRGRNGVEDRLERHQEAATRDAAQTLARVAALEQWRDDRVRTDTISVSAVQRSWWDRGLGVVGAALVGLALGGGAVGVVTARACEAPPAAVRPP